MKTPTSILTLPFLLILLAIAAEGQGELDPPQCGPLAGGRRCPNGFCCSKWGFCGTTDAYCNEINCESQCPDPTPFPPPILPPPPYQPLTAIFPKELFEEFLKNRNNESCNGRGFYTYEAFIEAAKDYPDFAHTGNVTTRKREIAAFFGLTSSFTNGGFRAPDGQRRATGYCRLVHGNTDAVHCRSSNWPCAPGKKYYGRGPMAITGNDNYGLFGEGLGLDLINDPDLVETDPVICFKTAIWRWMAELGRPSCHGAITGRWVPSQTDLEANRLPGYGTAINILIPGECGRANPNSLVESAVGYYKRYCDLFGIDYGDNIDCYNQRSFWDDPRMAFI